MARRQSTDRLLAQAQRAIEQDQIESARVLLEAAARQDAADPRPWLLLAGIAPSARERRAFLAQADRLKAAPAPPAAPLRAVTAAAVAPATVSYPAPLDTKPGGSTLARTGLIIAVVMALAFGGYLFSRSSVGEALVQDLAGQTVAGQSMTIGETADGFAVAEVAPSTQRGATHAHAVGQFGGRCRRCVYSD